MRALVNYHFVTLLRARVVSTLLNWDDRLVTRVLAARISAYFGRGGCCRCASRTAVQETVFKGCPRSGSINEVGWRFQSFRINNLEMVAQICPRWNRVADWLRETEHFSTAA